MGLKEHDVIVTTEEIEYISSPPHSNKDTFAKLPVGTTGTIVSPPGKGGCYVELTYILEQHPHASPVMWLSDHEFRPKED